MSKAGEIPPFLVSGAGYPPGLSGSDRQKTGLYVQIAGFQEIIGKIRIGLLPDHKGREVCPQTTDFGWGDIEEMGSLPKSQSSAG